MACAKEYLGITRTNHNIHKRAPMKHRSIPTLARASALFVLLLVVMALGLQPTVWATSNPVQAGQTVPTRTPGPRLNLGEIRCDGQDVRVEFLVVHLPHGISDYGA